MAAGQLRGARSTLEQALRQSPGDPRLLLGQAELSLRLRKPRRALELARRAAAEGLGSDPRLLAARAEAALERLELEEAERCATELARLEPERPAGSAWLARVLAVAGRPAEAHRALLPWLKRCPLAPEVLVARAVLHEQAGAAEAAASLRRLALRMGAIETGQ
jgi:predicted Zn-dependent protease